MEVLSGLVLLTLSSSHFDPKRPIQNVRFDVSIEGLSGRATDVVKATFMTRSCRFRMYTRPTRACGHLGGGPSRDSQKAMIDCGRTADSKGVWSPYFWFSSACQETDFKSSVVPGTPSQNPASSLAALRQLSRKTLAATAPENPTPLVRLTPSSIQAVLSLPAPNRRPSPSAAWASSIRVWPLYFHHV